MLWLSSIPLSILFNLRLLTFGSAVEVTGILKKSPHQKQPVELEADQIHITGKCDPVVKSRITYMHLSQSCKCGLYIWKYNLLLSFRIFPLKSKRGTALSTFATFLISGAEQMPSAPCWEYEVRPLQQFTHISRWQHQWRSFDRMQSEMFCIYVLSVF